MTTQVFISKDQQADRSAWIKMCNRCDYATFFHTPYWMDLFTCAYNCSRHITFSDTTEVIVPLAYQTAAKGLVKVYQSLPANTFGGWLSNVNLSDKHDTILLQYLMQFKDLVFRENPYYSNLSTIEIKHSADDFTYTIPLQDGYENVLKSSDYSHRKAIRKAQNNNISVIASEDQQIWDTYYSLYNKSITRWKNRKIYSGAFYSKNFIQRIKNLDKSQRTLWIALLDSIPIAGIICFYWNRHAVAWHGAADEKYFNLRPNNLLYNTAIMDACNRGFNWFDCNPSGGIPGVIQFKKYMGAIELRSRLIVKKSLTRSASEIISSILMKR